MRLYTLFYTIFVSAVALVGLLILATVLPIPGNVEVRVVESGSMEPAIMTGSVVVIRPEADYQVGDVITFASGGLVPTTHRILAFDERGAERAYVTRGDANSADDPGSVSQSSVLGKVIFDVPYAGYVIRGAREPLGFAFLVLLPALIIVIESVSKIIAEVRRVRAQQRTTEASKSNV